MSIDLIILGAKIAAQREELGESASQMGDAVGIDIEPSRYTQL
jgi:hypothetical protein